MEFYDCPLIYIGNVMIPTDEIRSFRGVGWLNHQPIWMVQAVPSCAMSTILWVKVMNMVGAPKHVEKALEASERWMGAWQGISSNILGEFQQSIFFYIKLTHTHTYDHIICI